MTDLDRLVAMCPMPAHPIKRVVNWERLSSQLAVMIPQDYREVYEAYGLGRFGDFFHLYVPESPHAAFDLETQIDRRINILAKTAGVPYSIDSLSSGLLPIGGTDNGDVLHYLMTMGRSEGIVIEGARDGWAFFRMSMPNFLCSVWDKAIVSPIFPSDIVPPVVTFEPWPWASV